MCNFSIFKNLQKWNHGEMCRRLLCAHHPNYRIRNLGVRAGVPCVTLDVHRKSNFGYGGHGNVLLLSGSASYAGYSVHATLGRAEARSKTCLQGPPSSNTTQEQTFIVYLQMAYALLALPLYLFSALRITSFLQSSSYDACYEPRTNGC